MKLAVTAVAAAATLGIGLAACTTVTTRANSPQQRAPPASYPAAPNTSPPSGRTSAQPPAPQANTPSTVPDVTSPWAVVSAYYGAIESQDYQQAWSLLNSGATTGQSYRQFVDGFACTGGQQLSEVSTSGDQVTFNLDATDSCNGQVQHFTGTDTVMNGKIVAAHIVQTG